MTSFWLDPDLLDSKLDIRGRACKSAFEAGYRLRGIIGNSLDLRNSFEVRYQFLQVFLDIFFDDAPSEWITASQCMSNGGRDMLTDHFFDGWYCCSEKLDESNISRALPDGFSGKGLITFNDRERGEYGEFRGRVVRVGADVLLYHSLWECRSIKFADVATFEQDGDTSSDLEEI